MIVVISGENVTGYYYKMPYQHSYRNTFYIPEVGFVNAGTLTPPCKLAVIIKRYKAAGMEVRLVKGSLGDA